MQILWSRGLRAQLYSVLETILIMYALILGTLFSQWLTSESSFAVIYLVPSDPGLAPHAPWNLSIFMIEHLFSMCSWANFSPAWTKTLFWLLGHRLEPSCQLLYLEDYAPIMTKTTFTYYLFLLGAFFILSVILTETVQGR